MNTHFKSPNSEIWKSISRF